MYPDVHIVTSSPSFLTVFGPSLVGLVGLILGVAVTAAVTSRREEKMYVGQRKNELFVDLCEDFAEVSRLLQSIAEGRDAPAKLSHRASARIALDLRTSIFASEQFQQQIAAYRRAEEAAFDALQQSPRAGNAGKLVEEVGSRIDDALEGMKSELTSKGVIRR